MIRSARTVVQTEQDGPLQVREVKLPDPKPHQIQIRVLSSGICQSQVYHTHLPRLEPVLFGHEGYGIATRVGSDVTGVREGDHVLITWLPRIDQQGRLPEKASVDLGGGVTARAPDIFTWADYTLADELYVRPLPAYARDETIAIVGCAVITGAGAVLKAAPLEPGDDIAIFGAGGVGLCAVVAASIIGAGRIVAVDLQDSKLELARRLGATDVVNARRTNPVEAIHKLFPGKCGCAPGVKVAYDCVAIPETIQQGLDSARAGVRGLGRGGCCVVIGIPKVKFELDAFNLMANGKSLIGFIGSSYGQDEIETFLDWHRDGRLNLSTLVTDRFDLEKISEGVAALVRGDIGGRALIVN